MDLRILTLILLIGSCVSASATEVEATRVWGGPEYTRTVFEISGPVEYRLFTLQNPDRIVIDMRGSSLSESYNQAQARGAVTRVRSGRQNDNDLRIVLDVNSDVQPKSFLLPPAENFGHRLVVDLYPRNNAEPAVVRTVASSMRETDRDVVVAIDAGHGGEDPGAIGPGGTYEKNATLAIARELAQMIDAEPGMRAVLIRSGDYFIPLRQRFERARESRADLFVSIHADAFHTPQVSGASVFVLSQRTASNEAARWLAERENRSDLVGGVSLNDKDDTLAAVLLDLSQGATLEASNAVAERVLASLGTVGRTHKRHVERANFAVLRSPDVPSILVETAFISNPEEERRLSDPAHRRRLAGAVRDGVREYFYAAPPPGTLIASMGPSQQHVVSRGETLSGIARRHNVSVAALRASNQLNSDLVRVGDVLRIPTAASSS